MHRIRLWVEVDAFDRLCSSSNYHGTYSVSLRRTQSLQPVNDIDTFSQHYHSGLWAKRNNIFSITSWRLIQNDFVSLLTIVQTASFFRVRYELQFESLSNQVFSESSKFASESISAFRTVTSLTLENMICHRYELLLENHVKNAFKKAKYSTLVFAASDSVGLLCMALTFWYGGRYVVRSNLGISTC